MNRMVLFVGLLVILAVAGCGGSRGGTTLKGTKPFKAKINLKLDGTCKARTVPKSIDFEKGEYDSFIWTIKEKVKDECLPDGVTLELRFTSGNPTGCVAPISNAADKNKIECDLGTFTDNKSYKYEVWLVGGSYGTGKSIEDPDIEIVVF